MLTEKEQNSLCKEFKVNDQFAITRADYEWMPSPLMAFHWTDKQMQNLAREIAKELDSYHFQAETQEDAELAFYAEMENVAVRLGMKYYEDVTDEEYKQFMNEQQE